MHFLYFGVSFLHFSALCLFYSACYIRSAERALFCLVVPAIS